MIRGIVDRPITENGPLAATAAERIAIARLYPIVSNSADLIRIVGPDGAEMPLTRPLQILLAQGAEALLSGNAVVATPLYQELTTTEAARFLGVSRPYLYRLLDEGVIPYTRVGTHRRVKLSDLLTFQHHRDAETADALAELTRLSEEAGLYESEK